MAFFRSKTQPEYGDEPAPKRHTARNIAAALGAGAARAAALGAGAAPRDTLAGALRGGGATGVVAMTWISGSFVADELPLELDASCAATVPGAIATIAESAQGNPRSTGRVGGAFAGSAEPVKLRMLRLTMPRI